jgi:hypothetical protein
MYVPVDEQKLNAAQRQQPLSIITENEVFEKVTNALKISAPVG